MTLPIPESLRLKIQGVRICLDCDFAQCECVKKLDDSRYVNPIRGECSFCKGADKPLVWCRCDLRPCPDGCGCSMQIHSYGARSRQLWCSKQKCWGFRHATVMVIEPKETQARASRSETPEMVFDAIELDNLPDDFKMKAANDL